MDVYSTELGIRLSFGKTLEFRGGGCLNPLPVTPLFWIHRRIRGRKPRNNLPGGELDTPAFEYDVIKYV
jgi:hypothetical protein